MIWTTGQDIFEDLTPEKKARKQVNDAERRHTADAELGNEYRKRTRENVRHANIDIQNRFAGSTFWAHPNKIEACYDETQDGETYENAFLVAIWATFTNAFEAERTQRKEKKKSLPHSHTATVCSIGVRQLHSQ